MANLADKHGLGCGGRLFAASKIALRCQVVATCRGLSRKELANTISELVGWTRAHGSLKEAECLLLRRLEAQGLLRLPAKQQTRPMGSAASIPHMEARYSGGCYRVGVEIGQSSGRGRDDRQHRPSRQPKRVLVYRLRRDAQARRRGDSGRS